jgi:site-specific DNA-cytosine methylase
LIGTLAARDYKGIGNQYVSENKIVVDNAVLGSGKDIANTIPASLYHHGTVVNQDANNGHVVVHSKILTIDGTRVGDVRVSDDQTMQTVIQRWGTGGGNVPMVAKIIGTLQARDYKGLNHEGARDGKAIIGESSQVRRLTPTECERLQGFPDGWTEGQADSHRYKQMGNAVAVPVVQWLIDRV